MGYVIPKLRGTFWFPHKVQPWQSMKDIALAHNFRNAGPLVAFNADKLPGAISSSLGGRKLVEQGTQVVFDPRYDKKPRKVPGVWWEPLKKHQINSGALENDGLHWHHGTVFNLNVQYDPREPLDPAVVPIIQVPWSVEATRQYYDLQLGFRRDLMERTARLLNEQTENLKDIKDTLFAVDLAAALATYWVQMGKLGYDASKNLGTAVKTDLFEEVMTGQVHRFVSFKSLEESALKIIAAKRDAFFQGFTSWQEWRDKQSTVKIPKKDPTEAEILAMKLPAPPSLNFKKDLGYFADNTVGWFNPSKWTRFYASKVEDDPDILWHGTDAHDKKVRHRIISSARKRLREIDNVLGSASVAFKHPIHKHRVYPANAFPTGWGVLK